MLEPAWTILQQSKTCCLGVLSFPWFSMFSLCLNLVPWSNVLPRELFDMLDYDGSGTIGTFGFRFPNLVGSNTSAGWAGADNPQKKKWKIHAQIIKVISIYLHLWHPRNRVFSSNYTGVLFLLLCYSWFPEFIWSISWLLIIMNDHQFWSYGNLFPLQIITGT